MDDSMYDHMMHNKAKKRVRKENENFEKTEPKRIAKLNNKELYESLLSLAAGDDWDGGMTYKGQLTFDYYKTEFERRLKDWLEK